ncbi:MAG: DUF4417 domain-containing protein [Oscillospiraceae bacterium]|nr:DUF4417 domain-containing protein [Oscillospiraceae bacterium]
MTSEEFRADPLFARSAFECEGKYDMPIIKRQEIDIRNVGLIGFDHIKPGDRANAQSFVHFFLDDYKFGVIWSNPEPRVNKLRQYKGVLSPAFSVYYDLPAPIQIHNYFRSRWCGAYLQYMGLDVIPTVTWGLRDSYPYCFDGIEKSSVVAVSTLGVRKQKDYFMQGYEEMLKRIEPEAVICYSNPFDEMQGNVITVGYNETNNYDGSKFWNPPQDYSCYKMEPIYLPETPWEELKSYCIGGEYPKTANCFIVKGGGSTGGGPAPETHHVIPHQNKKQTPKYKETTDKYNLNLNQEWNKVRLAPHRGRHSNSYHKYIQEKLNEYDKTANGNFDKFLALIEELILELKSNPGIMYDK